MKTIQELFSKLVAMWLSGMIILGMIKLTIWLGSGIFW